MKRDFVKKDQKKRKKNTFSLLTTNSCPISTCPPVFLFPPNTCLITRSPIAPAKRRDERKGQSPRPRGIVRHGCGDVDRRDGWDALEDPIARRNKPEENSDGQRGSFSKPRRTLRRCWYEGSRDGSLRDGWDALEDSLDLCEVERLVTCLERPEWETESTRRAARTGREGLAECPPRGN